MMPSYCLAGGLPNTVHGLKRFFPTPQRRLWHATSHIYTISFPADNLLITASKVLATYFGEQEPRP
jgi:hypothetical protein